MITQLKSPAHRTKIKSTSTIINLESSISNSRHRSGTIEINVRNSRHRSFVNTYQTARAVRGTPAWTATTQQRGARCLRPADSDCGGRAGAPAPSSATAGRSPAPATGHRWRSWWRTSPGGRATKGRPPASARAAALLPARAAVSVLAAGRRARRPPVAVAGVARCEIGTSAGWRDRPIWARAGLKTGLCGLIWASVCA